MQYCLIDFPLFTQGKVTSFLRGCQNCDSICQRFSEMGIRKNASIQVVGRLPFSRNVHVIVGNESLVLRQEEACCLEVISV